MNSRRRLTWGMGGIVAAQILIWLAAGSIAWSFRDLMVGVGTREAADGTRFAIAILFAAGINAVALITFLLRTCGPGWSLLMAVQIADLIVTLVLGASVSPWWWLISGVAAVTVPLLFRLRSLA